MLRKIKLYGQLAEVVGHKDFDVDGAIVQTPAHAVRF